MRTTGNTILITGGGSGIGKALAEKLHAAGNKIIIAGRDAAKLDTVAAANPGMAAMTFDVGDADSIETFAQALVAEHPDLNVILNNAGIMQVEDMTKAPANLETAEQTIATNLLGPIRLTSALLPHLLAQPASAVIMVSSGLAFVPLASTPTYSASKAAIHAYALSLRYQLKDTSIEVIEIAPPYVQTELMGAFQATDPKAMPLAQFTDEVMAILAAEPTDGEVIVEFCKPLRFAIQNGNFDQMFAGLNAAH
jgi:uncharacterized oxidoreductase